MASDSRRPYSSGSDGVVKVWDEETLLQVARIPTGEAATQLAFDRDRLLASGRSVTQAWRCDRYSFSPSQP